MTATSEIKVTDSSNRAGFEQIDREFSVAFHSKPLVACDGLDEAYHDHEVDGSVVTVHLQHYLGVRIFLRQPEKATARDLQVLQRIKAHYDQTGSVK